MDTSSLICNSNHAVLLKLGCGCAVASGSATPVPIAPAEGLEIHNHASSAYCSVDVAAGSA